MRSSQHDVQNTETSFVCACQEWQRSSCANTGFYKEYQGQQFCVIHYPNQEKLADFSAELQERLKNGNYHFSGAWFPSGTYFYKFQFKTDADFSQAKFTTFADFAEAIFDSKVSFYGTTFADDAIFHNAVFHGDTDFKFAQFHQQADFNQTLFHKIANFSHARFFDHVLFTGDEDQVLFAVDSYLSLQHAQISNPEKILFQHLTLRPSWFVGVTVCNFVFSDVTWKNKIAHEIDYVPQIVSLSHVNASPDELLAVTYRQLAINAEENHRYDEAAHFRYASMDVQRRVRWRGMAFWRLNWWYWLLSGYGEKIGRAAISLLIVLVLFAVVYTQVTFEHPTYQSGASLTISQAILYSLEVGALQKPEPNPLTQVARYIVLAETVIVPVQIALIALAIRRKFMR